MKTTINENEYGLMFRDGKFLRPLPPGTYRTFRRKQIAVVPIDRTVPTHLCPLDTFLRNEAFASLTTVIEVSDEQLALHFVNGRFAGYYSAGKYAFWNALGRHEFLIADTSAPEIPSDVPEYVLAQLPSSLVFRVRVAEYQKARLFCKQKLTCVLDPGTYYFWNGKNELSADFVDTRLLQLEISGQEILTHDKVALRISVVCHYRIADCVRVLTEIDDYEEQLHAAVQLALREYVCRLRFDEVLESRDQLSAFLLNKLKEKEGSLFLTIADAGVRDIILPGEIRSIMNTVLMAEKKAQANVITRREEVASTRSLLNTARLMDENATLYKLKELEYLQKICENVGSINVTGSGDILSQLANVIGRKEQS